MSRIYVDRISPYQSGSVQVDGLSFDTGSLATTASFNAYTSSNDSKVNALISATSSYQPAGDYATTGSNTFNGTQTFNVGDGAFALRANFNNSFFYSVGAANLVGVVKNDFSEATTIGLGSGHETYNSSADVGLNADLNAVTSQGDDRPGIYAYSGSVARDVIALPKLSWDGDGQVEFKTPISTNQNVTSNSNLTVYGNFQVSGSGANNRWFTDWPGNFNEKQITTFGGLNTWEGDAYNDNFQKIINYGQFGANLEGLVTSFNDSGASNYYTSQWIGPRAAYWLMFPSGAAQDSTIKLQKDSGASTTTATITSDTIDINGPVTLDQTLKLEAQDPLPGGSVGELAVSGSNLYFHNGTSWSQIN